MERYFARFMARDGRVRRWSIYDDLFIGDAEELTLTSGGISIEEDNSSEAFEPIRTWTGFANILSQKGIESFVANSAHQYKTEIKVEDGEVEWSGYITPDVQSQNYPAVQDELNIPLRGRLATAEGYYISRGTIAGFVQLSSLLYESLILTGFSDTDVMYWPETYSLKDGKSIGLEVLLLAVSRARFFNDKSERNKVDVGDPYEQRGTESAFVVISEIMKLFGYTMYERGGAIVVSSPQEQSYRTISLSELNKLSSNLGQYPLTEISPIDIGTLEGEEQLASICQGAKEVTVDVLMDREDAESLPGTGVEQFQYLADYVRQVNEHAIRLKNSVFHNISDNIRTYVYYRNSTDPSVPWYELEDNTGWLKDNKLEDSGYPPLKFESRPGMFPVRVAKYNQSDYDNGKLKNYKYVDGYMFNPANKEDGDLKLQIDGSYPLLTIRNGKETSYKGGTFLINFDIVGNLGKSSNPGSPADNGVKVYMSMRIGDMYWDGKQWIKSSSEIKFEVPIANNSSNLLDMYASGPEDQKTIKMPYNDKAGYFAELKDASGATLEIQGEAIITMYIDATHLNSRVDGYSYKFLFLSNVEIEYLRPDEDLLKRSTGNQNKNRVLHKKTEQGFDEDEGKVTLMLGSYAYDSGAALCTLTYAGKNISKIKRISDGTELPPEEFLLGNLFSYYNRIIERRELTIRQDAPISCASSIIMDGKEWRQISIAEDYGSGSRRLTIESI